MASSKQMEGMKFGRLTLVKDVGFRGKGTSIRYYRCLCDCGKEAVVAAARMKNGEAKSCGCLSLESRRIGYPSHGATVNNKVTPEYQAWVHMRTRCYNPKSKMFPSYGGRGITVCAEWRKSFQNFIADMGLKPSSSHSIDRIDNNGDYTPENCRWATKIEQARNRNCTLNVSINGKNMPLTAVCEQFGLSANAVKKRMGRTKESATESFEFIARKHIDFNLILKLL